MKIAVISDSVDFTQFPAPGIRRIKATVYPFKTFREFIESGKSVQFAVVNMNEGILKLIRKHAKLNPVRMQAIKYILFSRSAETLSLLIGPAIKQGAVGFISEAAQQDELAAAIEKVKGGGQYFSSDIREELINIFLSDNEPIKEFDEATEKLITERLCASAPSKLIAKELSMKDYHVRHYKKIILQKWNVKSMKELSAAVAESNFEPANPIALRRLPQTG